MSPLRIAFDIDGVLAYFAAAYHDVELRLFGPAESTRPGDPEQEPIESQEKGTGDSAQASDGTSPREGRGEARELRRRRDAVWGAIRATPDFWMTLQPTDPAAVRRIHEMARRHPWEVFFFTKRPATAGDTVQRQTQRWLVKQGFDLPSVLVIPGARGAAANALQLDYHVDDSATNCMDVKRASAAHPILIVQDPDEATLASARKLGIGTARAMAECLDILEQASTLRAQPSLLARFASLIGW